MKNKIQSNDKCDTLVYVTKHYEENKCVQKNYFFDLNNRIAYNDMRED